MIGYFDTSAFVPMLVAEPSTAFCRHFWDAADAVVTTRILHAARLAHLAALRGYDAVHCASAEQVQDDDLVFASGDRRLLSACVELGMMTADINEEPVH